MLVCYYRAKLTGMWRVWIPALYAVCAAAGAIRVAIQMPERNETVYAVTSISLIAVGFSAASLCVARAWFRER